MTPARRAATIMVILSLLLVALPVGLSASASARGRHHTDRVTLRTAPGVQHRVGPHHRRLPLLGHREFPDPTGATFRGRYVAIATGSLAPRSIARSVSGPWRDGGTALARIPRWATGRTIWASDLVRVRHRWLLYFAAPVAGLGPLGRCIGVAVARSPLQKFHPVGPPITCPRWARTPDASDPVRPPSPSVRSGVIDPESFVAGNGSRYLLYRTQGTPSSIRMVALTPDGTRARFRVPSRTLATSGGVVENPVLVQQRHGWVLITSEGYYGGCDYRTTWRRARLLKGLKHARAHPLVTRRGTRLCGPGGADLIDGSTLVLHAWTCRDRGCPHVDLQAIRRYGARRSLFATRLTWDRLGRPHRGAFVKPATGDGGPRHPHHPPGVPDPEPDDDGGVVIDLPGPLPDVPLPF